MIFILIISKASKHNKLKNVNLSLENEIPVEILLPHAAIF